MLVRIKAETIRRNPRAGETEYGVLGLLEQHIVRITKVPGGYRKEEFISVGTTQPQLVAVQEAVNFDGTEAECPANWKSSIINRQPVNWLQSFWPDPEYLFEHEDPVFNCSACGCELVVSQLESDCLDVLDGNLVGTNTKCPHCHAWDAVKLEFETIEQAMARENNK